MAYLEITNVSQTWNDNSVTITIKQHEIKTFQKLKSYNNRTC